MTCPDCPYSKCIGAQCRMLGADLSLAFKAVEKIRVTGLLLTPKVESGELERA